MYPILILILQLLIMEAVLGDIGLIRREKDMQEAPGLRCLILAETGLAIRRVLKFITAMGQAEIEEEIMVKMEQVMGLVIKEITL